MNQQLLLRQKILDTLTEQGFVIFPHLKPKNNSKKMIRSIHNFGRIKSLKLHSKFLKENHHWVKEFAINGNEIHPEEIKLELRYVKPRSVESKIFFWWNLAWWSIPYVNPVGRQIKFIIWDRTHDAPFGLLGLSSPPLKMSIRDKFLKIPNEKHNYWINMSMYGQRVGALPPYNDLLGGKLTAMVMTSNELREVYSKKYKNKITLKEQKKIPSNLLFVTTTSAFGKSSMYERIYYHGERVEQFLGFTKGIGSFYVPIELYHEIIDYLKSLDCNIKNIPGGKSSRKIKLIHTAFDKLGIKRSSSEGIKRGFYLFSNVRNLMEVIHNNKKPFWYDRPFDKIQNFWLNRYAIPRSKRITVFQHFDSKKFFEKISLQIQ